jgi:hypothetical protein
MRDIRTYILFITQVDIFPFVYCALQPQFWALAASIKLSVSFQLLDIGHSAGLLGRVISSSQRLC